jgi:hypothetical protein
MKRLALLSMLVLLLVAFGGSAGAQDPFYLAPYMENSSADPYIIDEGTELILEWAWMAATKGLLTSFEGSWSASYTILDANGDVALTVSEADADRLWSPGVSFSPAAAGLHCPMPKILGAYWTRNGVFLQAGAYRLVTDYQLKHPVNDGLHTCSVAETGEAVAQPPSKYGPDAGTWTVYFVVQ